MKIFRIGERGRDGEIDDDYETADPGDCRSRSIDMPCGDERGRETFGAVKCT